MDVVYRLQGIEFEWDANKAQSNREKHDVKFEEATEVFSILSIKLAMLPLTMKSENLLSDILHTIVYC